MAFLFWQNLDFMHLFHKVLCGKAEAVLSGSVQFPDAILSDELLYEILEFTVVRQGTHTGHLLMPRCVGDSFGLYHRCMCKFDQS